MVTCNATGCMELFSFEHRKALLMSQGGDRGSGFGTNISADVCLRAARSRRRSDRKIIHVSVVSIPTRYTSVCIALNTSIMLI